MSGGAEIRICDIRSVLDCCCQIAIDIVQAAWSPFISFELHSLFGAEWRSHCEDLLGPQSKHHIPSGGDQASCTFDFHQICMLLSKLTQTLAPPRHCAAEHRGSDQRRGAPSRHAAASHFAFDEQSDRARHLLNSLSTFRQRFVHHGAQLSAKEVLATLLTMEELWALLEHKAPGLVRSRAAAEERDRCKYLFGEVKISVRKLCAPGHERTGASPACHPDRLVVSRLQALKIVGVLLLQGLTKHLQPVAAYAQLPDPDTAAPARNEGEYGDAKVTAAPPQAGADDACDLNGIYNFMKAVFKILKSASFLDSHELGQKKRFLQWILTYGTEEVRTKIIGQTSSVIKQLVTAFELLTGKNGLRNKLFHAQGGQDLTPRYLLQCVKKSGELLEALGRQDHADLLAKVSYYAQLLQRKANCPWVTLSLSPGVPAPHRPSSPSNPHQHYIQQARPHLFGRSADVKAVQLVLQTSNVVVLTGESGVGKTALAIQLAYELRREYSQQYWLSATTALALQLSISYIGKVNTAPSVNSRGGGGGGALQGLARNVHEAQRFLASSYGILLVLDDVLDADVLLSALPAACLANHTLLCTTPTALTARLLGAGLRGAVASHGLENLSVGDNIDYMTSLCPRLRRPEALSDATLAPDLWRFLEQRPHCSPLTVQLLAQCIRSSSSIGGGGGGKRSCGQASPEGDGGGSLAAVLRRFTAQGVTLADMQREAGASRYHRGVLASVDILCGRLCGEARTLLLVFSFLGRSGCTIPWTLFEQLPYAQLSQQLSAVDRSVGIASPLSPAVSRSFTQRARQDLQLFGILHWSEATRSASVPLLIQKASMELAFGPADGQQAQRSAFASCLCIALLELFDRVLAPKPVLERVSVPADCCVELSHSLAALESVLSTAAEHLSDTLRLQVMVRLGRGVFSHHMDWSTAHGHFKAAAELLDRCQAPPAARLLLIAELGVTELRENDSKLGRVYLQQARGLLVGTAQGSIVDPFGPFEYCTDALLQKIDHLITTAHFSCGDWEVVVPRLVEDLCRKNAGEPAPAGSAHGVAELSKQCLPPIGPLSDGMEGSTTGMACPDEFWLGLDSWSGGDAEAGIHRMLCAVLENAEFGGASGGFLPIRAMTMLVTIQALSVAIQEPDAFEFYSTVSTDLMQETAAASLQDMAPLPCREKLPAKVADIYLVEMKFREDWLKVFRKFSQSSMHRALRSLSFCYTLFVNMPMEQAFISMVKFLACSSEGIVVAALRLFLRLFRWYVNPSQTTHVLWYLARARKREIKDSWVSLHHRNTAPAQAKFQFYEFNFEMAMSNPVHRYIWHSVNKSYKNYNDRIHRVDAELCAVEIREAGESLIDLFIDDDDLQPFMSSIPADTSVPAAARASKKAAGRPPATAGYHTMECEGCEGCALFDSRTGASEDGERLRGVVAAVQAKLHEFGHPCSPCMLRQLALNDRMSDASRLLHLALEQLYCLTAIDCSQKLY